MTLPLKSATSQIPTKVRITFTDRLLLVRICSNTRCYQHAPVGPSLQSWQRPVPHGMWSSACTSTCVNAVISSCGAPLRAAALTGIRRTRSAWSSTPVRSPVTLAGWTSRGSGATRVPPTAFVTYVPRGEVIDGPCGIVRDDVLSAASILNVGIADIDSSRVPYVNWVSAVGVYCLIDSCMCKLSCPSSG